MRRLFRAEYYRLFHSWALLLLSVAFAVASPFATGAKTPGADSSTMLLILLCDRRFSALFFIVAGAYFFCMDFLQRGFNQEIYSGYSRGAMLFSKHICYLSFCAVISCISMAISFIICRDGVGAYEPWFLIKLVLFRLLVDIGFASLFVLFAYVLKKPTYMICAGGAYALFFMFSDLALYEHWMPLALPNPDYKPLILPLVLLVASPIIAYIVFKNTELR